MKKELESAKKLRKFVILIRKMGIDEVADAKIYDGYFDVVDAI